MNVPPPPPSDERWPIYLPRDNPAKEWVGVKTVVSGFSTLACGPLWAGWVGMIVGGVDERFAE